MQNPSEDKTGLQSNLCSFQSGVDLKFWRLFSGKNACTVVISWEFIYHNAMPQYDVISWHNLSIIPEHNFSIIPHFRCLSLTAWQAWLSKNAICQRGLQLPWAGSETSLNRAAGQQKNWAGIKQYFFLRKTSKRGRILILSPGSGALQWAV